MAQRVRLLRVALVPVAVSLAVGVAFLVVMLLHSSAQEKQARRQAEAHLSAVADAQAQAVHGWRQAWLAEATEALEDVPLARRVQRFLADPNDGQARREVESRLVSLARRNRFHGAFLIDPQGVWVLGGAEGNEPLGQAAQELAAEAMRNHQVAMSDLYREPKTGEPRLDLAAPILDPEARQAAPLGALVLRVDPRPTLYESLQPGLGGWSTLQGILLRQEEGGLRVLNEPVGGPGVALNALLPRDDGRLPVALVVSHLGGVVAGQGLDGAPALATLRMIPASPWYLVVQVQAREALAPRCGCGWVLLAGAVLLALAVAATLAEFCLFVREARARASERNKVEEEQAALRKKLAEAEAQARELREKKAQLEQELQQRAAGQEQTRTEQAIDAAAVDLAELPVMALDSDGRIVRFNPACERLTGYSFDELRGKEPWALLVSTRGRAAAERAFAKIVAGQAPGPLRTTWRSRAGQNISIRWAARILRDAAGNPRHVVLVEIGR